MTDVNTGPEADDELVDFGPPLQEYLAGNPRALTSLPPRERALAEQLAPILESARRTPESAPMASPAPPPEQAKPRREHDPIAFALGLVAGPEDMLDASRFKRVRLQGGLNINDIARRLTQRGWAITVKEVFRWQQGNTELAPALIVAIADILAVPAASIRARSAAGQPTSVAALLDDEVIAAFLTEWAHEVGSSTSEVRGRAQRTLTSMNYRNEGTVTHDDVLAVLRALRRLDPDTH